MSAHSNGSVKWKFFPRRRRHKLSLLAAIVALSLFIILLYQNVFASQTLQFSTIKAPEENSWFHFSLPKLFTDASKKKTVPFAHTDAHDDQQHEEPQSSSPTDDSDATKYRLIADFHTKFDPTHEKLDSGHAFFNDIFKILHNGKPRINKLNRYLSGDRIYHARYDTKETKKDHPVFTEQYLSQFLQLNNVELDSMRKSHRFMLKHLPEEAPPNLYEGDGIVIVGGGKFNWLALLSIKTIRAMGSVLPIEVLIPKFDEYEPDLCARVFPALNARCIYLPHMLSPAGIDQNQKNSYVDKFEFKGFQYKALAILVLSFENVLLLDSDNIPVHNPDHLFTKNPFTSVGLIVWPDFWSRATSPDYYKIAEVGLSKTELLPQYDEKEGLYHEVPAGSHVDVKKTPLHSRKGAIPDPTTESGQLMISKKSHTKALLLALYYNLYGPTHFYPLFSQGSDGEGDKETFLAAAVAAEKPFYQVGKFLNAFGHFDEHHEFQGTGMGQYDPVQDYDLAEKRALLATKSEAEQKKAISKDLLLQKGPRILFVHANYPKLNPWELKEKKKIFNGNGDRIRLYGTGMKLRTGIDFETVQWTNMKFLLCELKIEIDTFAKVNRKDLCSEISEHLDFLKSTINTLE